VVPFTVLRGRGLARGELEGRVGRVEELQEEVDEDAERGRRQVAHALGQRHGHVAAVIATETETETEARAGEQDVPPPPARRKLTSRPRCVKLGVTCGVQCARRQGLGCEGEGPACRSGAGSGRRARYLHVNCNTLVRPPNILIWQHSPFPAGTTWVA
jgi:hypothetical protein